MRRLISFGSEFEAQGGYSRAVVDGEWVFVAGTTGFDYTAMTIADDPAEQTRQTFRNIERALAEAGAALADIVRSDTTSRTATTGPASCRCWPKFSARSARPRRRYSAASWTSA